MYPWASHWDSAVAAMPSSPSNSAPLFSPNTDVFSLMEDYDSFCFTVAGKANKSSEKEAPTLLKIVQPLKAVTRHGTV